MEYNFIYDDLASQGDLGAAIHELQTKKDELESLVASLMEDIKKLCDKIMEMEAVQGNLRRNISELFKTAKNEVNRKDRRIAELQAQLDDMVFRRHVSQFHSGYKRKREESNSEEYNKKTRTDDQQGISVKNVGKNCDINNGTNKNSHKDETIIETIIIESNSRCESDRSAKLSYSEENNYRRERSTHRENPHKTMMGREKLEPDSHDSSKHEYNHSKKRSYSRENRGKRNDDHRDNKDSYQVSSKDNRMNNRGSRRDNWEHNVEHKDRGYRDKGHRDRSRGYRNNKRE